MGCGQSLDQMFPSSNSTAAIICAATHDTEKIAGWMQAYTTPMLCSQWCLPSGRCTTGSVQQVMNHACLRLYDDDTYAVSIVAVCSQRSRTVVDQCRVLLRVCLRDGPVRYRNPIHHRAEHPVLAAGAVHCPHHHLRFSKCICLQKRITRQLMMVQVVFPADILVVILRRHTA